MSEISELEREHLKLKSEFERLRDRVNLHDKVIYGFVGAVILAVIMALMNLVLKPGGVG